MTNDYIIPRLHMPHGLLVINIKACVYITDV